MVKLQRPPFVYMNGELTPWDDARIHVGAPALTRGISVFEGIKGYWNEDSSRLSLLALDAHFERLQRSALLQQIPFDKSRDEFRDACALIIQKLCEPDRDLWIRPTLFALEGHWGLDTVTDLVITCYHQDKVVPAPVKLGVSTWQRTLDTGLPYRIKSAANYEVGRLARIEGRRQGFHEMVMLNPWGRVSEGTGSCVLMVRDGCVVTPPSHEGCLESITVDIVESLAKSLGIPFERRPVDRTELRIADEIALAGTLTELAIVEQFEDRQMPEPDVLVRIRNEYFDCARAKKTHPAVHLTQVATSADS